jgi:uncharacterized membrane protein
MPAMFRKPSKDGEESLVFGTHIGDIGVIVVAAMLTIVLVLMLVTPSPFARLEKAQAQQEKAERQKAIDKAVATGEVSVSIAPAKKH